MMTSSIKTGSIVLVNLDPTVGQEIKKTRPCLVIEGCKSKFGLCIVLPITSGKKESPLYILIPESSHTGLSHLSSIDTYQLRTISTNRIIKELGRIDHDTLELVKMNLVKIFDIDVCHLG